METLLAVIQVLQLNSSFFIYLIVFSVFLILTDKLLLSPAYKRFLKQESLTKGQVLEFQSLQEKNKELTQEYEQKLIQYNQKIQDILNQKKQELLKKQQKQIEGTQKKAEQTISQTRESLSKEFKQAREQLFRQVPDLSQEFLTRINS